MTQQSLSWAHFYSLSPHVVQIANYKPSMDRDPLLFDHIQGILSSEQTEAKLFDLAPETGHSAFSFPSLLYASAESVSTLE